MVDASVAAKWLLRDEEHLAKADALLRNYDSGKLILYAPCQIDVEIAAVLRKCVLQQRVLASEGADRLDLWRSLLRPRLRLAENHDLLPPALARSLQLGITLFDALYLVLAEALAVPLVVADSRLLRSPAAQLPLIHSLSTFTAGEA